ncbi:MAG: DUF3833 family protein [Pseudomonadota bacterium]
MLKSLFLISIGVLITLGIYFVIHTFWSFSAQRTRDYAKESPTLDLKTHLQGNFIASGLIYDYTGRVNTRFRAKLQGRFDSRSGTLDENFVYSHGPTQKRKWNITLEQNGKFTATAADVIGKAQGEYKGNALVMRYRLQLPKRSGGYILDVVDWMYLLEDGTILNRSEMRKFNLKVAELFAVFVEETAEKN